MSRFAKYLVTEIGVAAVPVRASTAIPPTAGPNSASRSAKRENFRRRGTTSRETQAARGTQYRAPPRGSVAPRARIRLGHVRLSTLFRLAPASRGRRSSVSRSCRQRNAHFICTIEITAQIEQESVELPFGVPRTGNLGEKPLLIFPHVSTKAIPARFLTCRCGLKSITFARAGMFFAGAALRRSPCSFSVSPPLRFPRSLDNERRPRSRAVRH